MNLFRAAQTYLKNSPFDPVKETTTFFAPANIALIKYWGKRNTTLNVPTNSTISLDLGDHGATTTITVAPEKDEIFLNGSSMDLEDPFAQRILSYIGNVAPKRPFLKIETSLNIPVAAGVASSAAGFAALAKCLNDMAGWNLDKFQLSALTRLGSGSAARSLWPGFVEWYFGTSDDGSDSYSGAFADLLARIALGVGDG